MGTLVIFIMISFSISSRELIKVAIHTSYLLMKTLHLIEIVVTSPKIYFHTVVVYIQCNDHNLFELLTSGLDLIDISIKFNEHVL